MRYQRPHQHARRWRSKHFKFGITIGPVFHGHTKPQAIVRRRAKIGGNGTQAFLEFFTMRKNGKATALTLRMLAGKTVNRLEPAYGSKMLAYEKVAAVIGVSPSWMRKFITVPGTPEPRWSVGVALVAYYKSLCDRVDAEVTEQRREIAKIIGEINEANPLADDIPLTVSLAKRFGLNPDS